MISIFDDDGERLPINWHGLEFNQELHYEKQNDGVFTDAVAFSSPINYASEVIEQISRNGGGIEFYNPRINSRILNIRARVLAPKWSRLFSRLMYIQWGFHPLDAIFWHQKDGTGTISWPIVTGLPSIVRDHPLTFTRMNDSSFVDISAAFTDGKMLLEYHVFPLALPDPVIAATRQGVGATLDMSWLILDGGRSYARSDSSLSGDGDITPTWSMAPMWPRFTFDATGAGASDLTIAVTAGDYSASLVLDASGLSNGESVVVDTRDRSVTIDGVANPSKCHVVSGDWPVLRGQGNTDSVAWTNTTNTSNRMTLYRQSDFS